MYSDSYVESVMMPARAIYIRTASNEYVWLRHEHGCAHSCTAAAAGLLSFAGASINKIEESRIRACTHTHRHRHNESHQICPHKHTNAQTNTPAAAPCRRRASSLCQALQAPWHPPQTAACSCPRVTAPCRARWTQGCLVPG